MRLLIISSSRGDYGHLIPLVRAAAHHTKVEVSFLSTSNHPSDALDVLPLQWTDMGQLGVELPEHLGDWPGYLCGLSTLLASYLEGNPFDCAVILGDRVELLSLATILTLHRIPIVHLHGGETSLGAVDNLVRDAVSKLASIHLVSRQEHLEKLLRIGEDISRIVITGALAVDNAHRIQIQKRTVVEELLGFEIQEGTVLATLHPVTASPAGMQEIKNFFDDVELLDRPIIFTFPNQDPGSDYIRERIKLLRNSSPGKVKVIQNMGTELHYSTISLCDLVIGNSSSGIIDAPILGKASIDFGSRQQGRTAPASVLHCSSESGALLSLFRDKGKLAIARGYAKSIETMKFFGLPGVAERMLDAILARQTSITSVKNG